MPPVLELKDVTKSFPGVLANDHIDLKLEEGEILALLGENGAGKTTLMNILYGLYTPDEGEIIIRGNKVVIHDPRDAITYGIGMVHQHFMLVPVFTVTENVMLGIEKTRAGVFLDRESVAQEIREISERFGLKVDPNALVEDLPVGLQQRVEIIKVLYRHANILILDEPTAVLTPQEVEDLFKVVHSLVEQGISIIFISHKLNEVLEIADHITVLRLGKVVGTTTPDQATLESLASMMVGRTVLLTVEKQPAKPGEVVLEVSDLSVLDDRKLEMVKGIDFQVRAGEVLGVAGGSFDRTTPVQARTD
jgi:simple sugar transport system ATP-binding protein